MMVMDSGSNGGEVEKAHTHTQAHTAFSLWPDYCLILFSNVLSFYSIILYISCSKYCESKTSLLPVHRSVKLYIFENAVSVLERSCQ